MPNIYGGWAGGVSACITAGNQCDTVHGPPAVPLTAFGYYCRVPCLTWLGFPAELAFPQ
jgi:hypothetical protein